MAVSFGFGIGVCGKYWLRHRALWLGVLMYRIAGVRDMIVVGRVMQIVRPDANVGDGEGIRRFLRKFTANVLRLRARPSNGVFRKE